jgi:hypothetical protein
MTSIEPDGTIGSKDKLSGMGGGRSRERNMVCGDREEPNNLQGGDDSVGLREEGYGGRQG